MRSIGVALSLFAVGSVLCSAQSPPSAPSPPPAFEVASIRTQNDNMDKHYYQIQPRGMVVITNAPLRSIIARAHGIEFLDERYRLVAASDKSDRILATRFDIQAKPPEDAPPGQEYVMLQTLLVDRFNLRMRTETRHVPIYALTRARRDGKLGSDLRQSNHDCVTFMAALRKSPDIEEPRDVYGDPLCTRSYEFNTPRRGAYKMRDAGPIDALVKRVQGFVDRPVIDATGLTGNVDWVVSFSNDRSDPEMPSIAQALEDHLGLKLEGRVGPVEVFVIDSVEMPTPN